MIEDAFIGSRQDACVARAEAERAKRRLAFFAEASRVMTPDLDYQGVVRTLIESAVPELGDYCFFDVVAAAEYGPSGASGSSGAAAGAGPRVVTAQPVGQLPLWEELQHPVSSALRTGAAQLVPDVSATQRQEILSVGRGGALFGGRALVSLISVPLRVRGQALGVLTLCFGESERRHCDEDRRLAENLVGLAASAVEGAWLREDSKRTFAELERERSRLEAVSRSQQVLVEAGTLLASSLEYEVTLRRIAELAVPALADYCLIHMRAAGDGDGEIRPMAQVFREHIDQAVRSRSLEVAQLSSDNPVLIVLRTGKSVLIREVADDDLRAAAEDEQHLTALRASSPRSLICVPLTARGRTLGSMMFVSSAPDRTYDETDVGVAEALGQRAAWAVDSALLYQAAERARRRSEEARAEAETANRLKDNFLATVSHELRTPMAALLLWENILRASTDQAMRARALEAIHQSAVAQSKLIEDLLDVSRCISGKLRIDRSPVGIGAVIGSALEAALPLATAKKIEIDCAADSTLAYVMGDAVRLQQIIGNLLSNAIKFTDDGGRVTVRAERTHSRVEIAVSDTGKGIPASFLPDIFKPFSQADESLTRAQTGLGLGLAIVWQLVDMHQGTVRAESAGEGQGSTFTVTLPHLDLPARVSAVPARDRAAGGGRVPSRDSGRVLNRMRVLVVDDEPRVREAIAVVLRDAGAKVTTTASAEEAIGVLRGARWDVVVSDIGMPGEDGYSFIRRVRKLASEEGGDIAAVALTAYARAQDKERATEAGFDLHLAKPIDASELIMAIAELASGHVAPAALL